MKHAEERAERVQNRIADKITAFAGSMAFVYLHVVWFAGWIGFGVEKYPFGLLTMIVSLEAIFLSTFVMISQNRADAKRQALADQEWRTVQDEQRAERRAARRLEADPGADEATARRRARAPIGIACRLIGRVLRSPRNQPDGAPPPRPARRDLELADGLPRLREAAPLRHEPWRP